MALAQALARARAHARLLAMGSLKGREWQLALGPLSTMAGHRIVVSAFMGLEWQLALGLLISSTAAKCMLERDAISYV